MDGEVPRLSESLGLNSLEDRLRLQRWQLDERRRQLADFDRLAERLRQEAARLGQEEGPPAIERRARIEASLAAVTLQAQEAREALAEAYHELRRGELVAANRLVQRGKPQRRTRHDGTSASSDPLRRREH